ncbi:citramalate synthase [Dethiobacter alkaliphilus]|uniref:Citramalate synthase n=1 Tax=Dethiobacter alkaliphilus AHT 1 TaxID=555088 RepID=C0GHP2_DETAL|nr:citramalate synthase [Dethiobacter alkaliphilus]EEG77248.1 2-isopropylmalate synthase/homocitrate synthase family protein [Dethiobacter alkaliphilus AHT 1]
MSRLTVYDTTLRDGSQREGISFSVSDKLKITQRLDDFGIDYIEGGWPGSNPKDIEYFRKVRQLDLKHSKISAFSSTRRAGIRVQDDLNIQALLAAETNVVTIFGKSWDFHVTDAIGTTLEENLAMISDTVAYFKEMGREVIYDAEHFFDGYRHNPEYAMATIKAAEEAGADMVVLCDTNGGMMPFALQQILQHVRSRITSKLGIHAHDDAGMAVSNSIIAAEMGFDQIQGTINGYGERCGNANLCTIIPNLQLKLSMLIVEPEQLEQLTCLSRYVAELANLSPQEQQPYVGENAFAHKGGIHVDAVLKHAHTYEHLQPELVGNSRRILVSELSGKSNVLYKAREHNIDLSKETPETKAVLDRIKEMEYQGYQFEGAEASFELLIWKALKVHQRLFELVGVRTFVEKIGDNGNILSEATVKVRVDNREYLTAGEGNGPVHALDEALRKALLQVYPEIRHFHLVDYKVRVLDGKDGTGAKVRVLIETRDERKKKSWGTVGVSPNLIEASWQALVDSVEYGLMNANKAKMKELRKAVKQFRMEG